MNRPYPVLHGVTRNPFVLTNPSLLRRLVASSTSCATPSIRLANSGPKSSERQGRKASASMRAVRPRNCLMSASAALSALAPDRVAIRSSRAAQLVNSRRRSPPATAATRRSPVSDSTVNSCSCSARLRSSGHRVSSRAAGGDEQKRCRRVLRQPFQILVRLVLGQAGPELGFNQHPLGPVFVKADEVRAIPFFAYYLGLYAVYGTDLYTSCLQRIPSTHSGPPAIGTGYSLTLQQLHPRCGR